MFCGYVSTLLATCALPLLAPVQGRGRDYCRSPLPCTGGRRGNPPGPPREGAERPQGEQPHGVCPPCTLSAPSLPSGPPGGLPIICFPLARLLFFPCSLRALCPSSPPCRVAVATIAAPPLPCTGVRRGNPPARPAAFGRSRPPPRGLPHFELVLYMVDIPLIFH